MFISRLCIRRVFGSIRPLLIMTMAMALLAGCAAPVVKKTGPETNNRIAADRTTLKKISSGEKKYYQKALKELSKNNLGKAEAALKNLIKKRPDLAGPWANLALIHYRKNRLTDAEKAANKALELNPELPHAHNLLGLISTRQGEFKPAEKHYNNAIRYDNGYANAHYNLALLYDIYFQEIEKAVKHYRRYLEIIDHKDQRTADWLEQLENSLKS